MAPAEGSRSWPLARVLRITPRTIAFHKFSMMEQLGITSSAKFVLVAVMQYLVSG